MLCSLEANGYVDTTDADIVFLALSHLALVLPCGRILVRHFGLLMPQIIRPAVAHRCVGFADAWVSTTVPLTSSLHLKKRSALLKLIPATAHHSKKCS